MELKTLLQEIQNMYYNENLTVGEIAKALDLNPHYVYEAVYKAPIDIEFN